SLKCSPSLKLSLKGYSGWGGAKMPFACAIALQSATLLSSRLLVRQSLVRRNVTGFTNFEFAFAGKWLEALKEIKPGISEVLLIVNPNNPGTVGLSRFVEKLGPAHLVELILAPVQTASDRQLGRWRRRRSSQR